MRTVFGVLSALAAVWSAQAGMYTRTCRVCPQSHLIPLAHAVIGPTFNKDSCTTNSFSTDAYQATPTSDGAWSCINFDVSTTGVATMRIDVSPANEGAELQVCAATATRFSERCYTRSTTPHRSSSCGTTAGEFHNTIIRLILPRLPTPLHPVHAISLAVLVATCLPPRPTIAGTEEKMSSSTFCEPSAWRSLLCAVSGVHIHTHPQAQRREGQRRGGHQRLQPRCL